MRPKHLEREVFETVREIKLANDKCKAEKHGAVDETRQVRKTNACKYHNEQEL